MDQRLKGYRPWVSRLGVQLDWDHPLCFSVSVYACIWVLEFGRGSSSWDVGGRIVVWLGMADSLFHLHCAGVVEGRWLRRIPRMAVCRFASVLYWDGLWQD